MLNSLHGYHMQETNSKITKTASKVLSQASIETPDTDIKLSTETLTRLRSCHVGTFGSGLHQSARYELKTDQNVPFFPQTG